MKDTTAHADTGPLVKGEVYEVSAELAAHLKDIGLASATTAQTTADRNAELADDEGAAGPETNPSIEAQAAAAGTRPGDQSTDTMPQRQPLNRPATDTEQRAATQSAVGNPPERSR